MEMLRAQGAIELASAPTAGTLKGQGATEYLVLLAVVLIVALVSVALLGFFPGMASDAQETQSQAYWKGASPVAIVDMGPAAYYLSGHGNTTVIYMKLRNTGGYQISITKILGGDGYYGANNPALVLAPGEEKCIGNINAVSDAYCAISSFWIQTPTTPTDAYVDILRGADTMCDTNSKGRLAIRKFGFEYTETVEGQTVTKRQIGKPIYADCKSGVS